jgi:hypothetical protein
MLGRPGSHGNPAQGCRGYLTPRNPLNDPLPLPRIEKIPCRGYAADRPSLRPFQWNEEEAFLNASKGEMSDELQQDC